jgi:hypothetical protein
VTRRNIAQRQIVAAPNRAFYRTFRQERHRRAQNQMTARLIQEIRGWFSQS